MPSLWHLLDSLHGDERARGLQASIRVDKSIPDPVARELINNGHSLPLSAVAGAHRGIRDTHVQHE